MPDTRREMLEFVFAGPLFSIFKVLNQIRNEWKETRKAIMGLKDDLRQLNVDLTGALDNIASDQQRLEEKLSNSPVAEDVSEELAALRTSVGRARALDIPDTESAGAIDTGTAGAGSILTPPTPVPDVTTVQSPGEPISNVSQLPVESQPESVPPGQESGPSPVGPDVPVEDGTPVPDDSESVSPGEPSESDTPIGDQVESETTTPPVDESQPSSAESSAAQEDSSGEPTNS